MAGYSGTPLPKKLGIKDDHAVALLQAPRGLRGELKPLPAGVRIKTDLRSSVPFDVMLFFTKSPAELKRKFTAMAKRLQKKGGLWICC